MSFDGPPPGYGSPGFPSPNPHFPNPEHHQSDREKHGSGSSGPPPPPSGYRIPLTSQSSFPGRDQTGEPPCRDADGSDVFIGSALLANSVHPCKIGPHLYNLCALAYGGAEQSHMGRFDLLPFKPGQMEWVHASGGQIPPGRRPIEGGYEENGAKLYHAIAFVNGLLVPGKTGEHLGGANVSFGGQEISVRDNYQILCWR